MGISRFHVWFHSEEDTDMNQESIALPIFAACPSRAAKEYYNDASYKLTDNVRVRNADGHLFKYTVQELLESE
jgi:hypothetical protein